MDQYSAGQVSLHVNIICSPRGADKVQEVYYYNAEHYEEFWGTTAYYTSSTTPSIVNRDSESSTNAAVTVPKHSPKTNHILFVKVHKAASSTLQGIFIRYGLTNNLTFMLPSGSGNHIGWPAPFKKSRHARNKGTPDILCFHSIYSENMKQSMPNDSSIIGSVRNPYTQVKSAMSYYGIREVIETIIRANRTGTVHGFIVYNSQIKDLGMTSGFEDIGMITKYINYVDKTFDFVAVTEYFYESIIFMRDMLGWTNKDVMFFSGNQRKATTDKSEHELHDLSAEEQRQRDLVYNWAKADKMLYDYFSEKMAARIKQNGAYLEKEIEVFKSQQQALMDYCVAGVALAKDLKDKRFKPYGNGATGYILTDQGMANQTCVDLATTELPLVARINKAMNSLKTFR